MPPTADATTSPAAPPLPGIDGFLGTRGSLMLDVVFLAMFLIVPVLLVSVYLVHRRHQYQWHKRLQVTLGLVLLIAVTAFEIDMQLVTRWEDRAAASPYFDAEAKWQSPVGISLLIHLAFAIPTALLWVYTLAMALRKFPRPARPAPYSRSHRRWGWASTIGMVMTAITGWIFYSLAFVAG